jgi:hypothetical protein
MGSNRQNEKIIILIIYVDNIIITGDDVIEIAKLEEQLAQ